MIRTYFTLGVLALLCSGLQAQNPNMQATIPFDFQIGKTHLPAGDYHLTYAPSTKLLWLFEARTHKGAAILTIPVERNAASDTGMLKFNRYGDEYFFAGVWGPNSVDGSTVVKSSREKELAGRIRR